MTESIVGKKLESKNGGWFTITGNFKKALLLLLFVVGNFLV